MLTINISRKYTLSISYLNNTWQKVEFIKCVYRVHKYKEYETSLFYIVKNLLMFKYSRCQRVSDPNAWIQYG